MKNTNPPIPEGMPPIGSVWTKPAWMVRTILEHMYNARGKCWWVKIQHGTGTMEIPLSKWRKWADGCVVQGFVGRFNEPDSVIIDDPESTTPASDQSRRTAESTRAKLSNQFGGGK